MDHIQKTFPNAEVVILGDFHFHNINWLKYSPHTDVAELDAEAFAITNDLTQLIE